MQSVIPSLRVASVARSMDFYERALGMQQEFSLPGPDGELAHGSVRNGDASVMFGPDETPDGLPAGVGVGVVLYINLDDDADIDAAFDRAVAAGGTVVTPPADQFWGDRNWTIADPDGYHLTVGKTIRQMSEAEMVAAMPAFAPAD